MTATLPADLAQMREVARSQMRRTMLQAIEEDRELSIRAWGDLIEFARATLPIRLFEYIDVRASHSAYGSHEAWLVFRLPGCWPISARFTRHVQWSWSHCGANIRPLDDPSGQAWYAVSQDIDDPEWAQTSYCSTLGAALVVAQKLPRGE